jgi:hypothetical protein
MPSIKGVGARSAPPVTSRAGFLAAQNRYPHAPRASSKKVAGVPQLGVLRLAEPGGMSYGAALNSRARACSHWYLASLACQEPSAVNPATLS